MELAEKIESFSSGVNIVFNDSVICGGAVLNSYIILTAANCLYNIVSSQLITVEKTNSTSPQQRNVSKIVIHEEHSEGSFFLNIALVFLSDPFRFDGEFKPIKYLRHFHKFEGNVTVGEGAFTSIHKETTMAIPSKCYFHAEIVNLLRLLCTNVVKESLCPDREGVPVVCEHEGSPILCGLTTVVPSCNLQSYFTDVPLYGPWIENTIKKESVSKCKTEEFYCIQEEKCIHALYKCNGLIDCPMYNEDEKHCFSPNITITETAKMKCRVNEFFCETGSKMCISINKKCDGTLDCENGEDEIYCPAITPEPCWRNSSKTFRCLNGNCIPPQYVCDNGPDCPNRDDEAQCEAINLNKLIHCTENEYHCKRDSKCILKTSVCDKIVDCPFEDDEFNCPYECEVEEFSCIEGKCISKHEKCIAQYDCPNGDVASCLNGCPPKKISCDNGSSINMPAQCIPVHYRCDGDNDCLNAEDEKNCSLANKICQSDKFVCPSGHIRIPHAFCIPIEYQCDGDSDCLNGEDEIGCHFAETSTQAPTACPTVDFRCDNGKCIPNTFKCDGDSDCSNGEDERDCNVTLSRCHMYQFRCNDGSCISLHYKCDNDRDCPHGEDELDCPLATTTTVKPIICRTSEFPCQSGICIPRHFRCDMNMNCPNGDDEIDCPNAGNLSTVINSKCSLFEFNCQKDGKCIPADFKCDGESDCSLNEDEPDDCPYKAVAAQQIFPPVDEACPNTHYQCIKGQCIPSKLNCNGVPDCIFGDDETFCEQPKTNCSIDTYRCLNGKCIPLKFRCDGERDCYQGDDEYKCPQVIKSQGKIPHCDKACRRRSSVNAFNEAISRCCESHGRAQGGYCAGHFAYCH